MEEKTLLFSPSVQCPGEALLDLVDIWIVYPQALKQKKIGTWEATDIAKRRVTNSTHSAIASHGSSRVTTTFNAHCTVYCTVEDVNVKADSQYQKRSDQRPATCCATRARDSCRFTIYTSWRPAALRDHGTYTKWREENRLQLKGSEFLLVNCGF